MREIKFRAWDKRVKRMEYSENCDVWIIKPRTPELNIEIMQYTGLKDKNGKEVYEGDIVEYQYLNTTEKEIRRSEVVLMSLGDGVNRNIQAYFPFCYTIAGSYKERDREVVECFLTPSSDCEVIGNIKENIRLLKA